MLVAAAVCPHPPLLVPGVGAGASGELAGLRVACAAAVAVLTGAGPDLVVVVGDGPAAAEHGADASGSLAGYGYLAVFGGDGPAVLPLAHTVGASLLDPVWTGARAYVAVPDTTGPEDCRALGAALAGRAGRVGLLVMGDGSARRTATAPRPYDARAQKFDADATRALASVDTSALAALDPALARDLVVAGRASWQVLAGAGSAGTGTYTACLHAAEAPYGVGYVVASWLADGAE